MDSEALHVGVDGCPGGWLGVGLASGGSVDFTVRSTIQTVLDHFPHAVLVLVDIPIGLPDHGPRLCDRLARRAIGPRRSSVFPTPCRKALTAGSYARACKINKAKLGCSLSRQSWALAPRIADVDAYLRQQRKIPPRIREMHPEVCFWALADHRQLEHHKNKLAGEQRRREILRRHVHGVPNLLDAVRRRHPFVQTHDILDALVGAVTAQGPLQTLPMDPDTDASGLPMEMVYRAAKPFHVRLDRVPRRKRRAR